MTWFRCMGGNGGGGGGLPTDTWTGTLSVYKALSEKDNSTMYIIKDSWDFATMGVFIGSTQIFPEDINLENYEFYLDSANIPSTGKINGYNTGIEWLSGTDFELGFTLDLSSYTGTQVLASNSTNTAWNLILNGTKIKFYNSQYNQVELADISAGSAYKFVKDGSSLKFYKDDVLITEKSLSATFPISGYLCLFSWGTNNPTYGSVSNISFKFVNNS